MIPAELHDHAAATVQLAALHQELLRALRERRWADAIDLSAQSVTVHLRLQVYLNRIGQQ